MQIGQVLGGKYRLMRLLGDGGMGAVYESQHERLGTKVAIKILHPDIARRPGIQERFLQEAKVAAQIKSEHIVQVSDVDTTPDGLAYMVMELLEGEPLSSVLDREKKLPVPVACAYAIQILEALQAAHAMNVVHRDLKPDNVFVTFVGQRPVLKLIDFGIAKVRRDDQKNLTMAGITMGTAEYMAPEQAYSADRADARADVYSVGVILYEMLSGTRPALGETARMVAAKVERGEITPLLHAAPEVPQRIAGLCHRALAPRPEMRFASATEMRLALEAALSGGDVAAAPAVKGGTMMTAPHQAAFSAPVTPVSDSPSTQRTPPLPTPPAYAPAPMAYAPPVQERPRRRGNSGVWMILVGAALFLGAATVIVLVVMNNSATSPTPTPTLATTGARPDAVPSATTTNDQPLPALKTNNTTYVPAPSHPQPVTDAQAHAADAGSTAAPLPSFQLPPFTLPEAGVIPLPSGFPSTFPSALPSTLPPFFQPPP